MAKTWIVVSDSARARILTTNRRKTRLVEVKEFLHPQSRVHEEEVATEKLDRSFRSEAPGRHDMSETLSPKKHEAWKLCKELANEIEAGRTRGEFERLVIVAAPAFLGELRKRMSDPTSRLIVAELDKELAGMDTEEIRKHLPQQVL